MAAKGLQRPQVAQSSQAEARREQANKLFLNEQFIDCFAGILQEFRRSCPTRSHLALDS
jgi:hypothetical protein